MKIKNSSYQPAVKLISHFLGFLFLLAVKLLMLAILVGLRFHIRKQMPLDKVLLMHIKNNLFLLNKRLYMSNH